MFSFNTNTTTTKRAIIILLSRSLTCSSHNTYTNTLINVLFYFSTHKQFIYIHMNMYVRMIVFVFYDTGETLLQLYSMKTAVIRLWFSSFYNGNNSNNKKP